MKKPTRAILLLLLATLPSWLLFRPGIGAGDAASAWLAARFVGSDDLAQQAIAELAPDYRPWFTLNLLPAGSEMTSLLFALQAAIGAGVIGYWLGCAVTRARLRREAAQPLAGRETAGQRDHAD